MCGRFCVVSMISVIMVESVTSVFKKIVLRSRNINDGMVPSYRLGLLSVGVFWSGIWGIT